MGIETWCGRYTASIPPCPKRRESPMGIETVALTGPAGSGKRSEEERKPDGD